jgi:hypothetical protein
MDQKSARAENHVGSGKDAGGDEVQSGALVGKEATKKEKDELWMKQRRTRKVHAKRIRSVRCGVGERR